MGALTQGRSVYDCDGHELLAVPGTWANFPSLRFEGEDGHEDRRSFTDRRFDALTTLWVALAEAVSPG